MNTFTIEEIEQALSQTKINEFYFSQGLVESKSSVNYAPIVDYLTGVTPVLNSLQQDHKLYFCKSLLNLIGSIEKISAKEQLVLNVFNDPLLQPIFPYFLNPKMINDLYLNPSSEILHTVQTFLRQQGLNADDEFSVIATVSVYYDQQGLEIPDGVVKNYLLNALRNKGHLLYPYHMSMSFAPQVAWVKSYFKLLEEIDSQFTEEYIEAGLFFLDDELIRFFMEYKSGSYIKVIEKILQQYDREDVEMIRAKLISASRFYQVIPDRFGSIVKSVSYDYLVKYRSDASMARWEHRIPETSLQELLHIQQFPLSTVAVHYLFTLNHTKASELIKHLIERKAFVDVRTIMVLHHHLGNEAFEYIEQIVEYIGAAGGVDYYRELFSYLQKISTAEKYIYVLWKMGMNKSNQIKTFAAELLAANDPEAETKAIALLDHKKGEVRLFGAKILSLLSSANSKRAILNVLHKEQNDAARDLLLESISSSLPADADDAFIQQMIEGAAQRGKLQKPVEEFLDESKLAPLYKADGTAATPETIRFFLYRMSRLNKMQSDTEGNYIIQTLDKAKAAPFALQLLQLYKEKHFKPEHKYLLAAAALLGNDEVTDKLRTITNTWIEEGRYKMAEYGVGALALQGSDKALRWVEWYSRKYRSKKANVGAAALTALEQAAEELNISTHELGDRIVPDFGFDGLYKSFTIGNEEYRAFIDSKFKLAFFNEDNKQLKAIPAAADAALKEEFKAIAKEVRDVVKSQSPRMEYYLIVQRRWSFAAWQAFFLNNPVMFIYATKLVWAVYANEHTIETTFTCNEDSSLIDVNHDEVSIPEEAMIGMVHPTQLAPAVLQQWQQFLFDEKVDQVFPQLDRKIPDLSAINLHTTILHQYEGRHMQTGSIRSTLERYGWHKGPTGDGGMLESMRLLYFEKKLEAILEVEGVGAGYGWGMDEKLGRLYVIDKTKTTTRWDTYPKNEEDEKLVAFDQLPPIFMSEMLAAIEAIKQVETAKS
ncbi:DUF4132 domain-containing protein [Lacibacter sp.]|uniref:DUF4132 domain-containing protein n=1 Tax=Lacibacter sp. TaxID=1915409 RepID=UPI002B4B5F14|nr:DUF4132 domain-containing protein [Lacibacter sp.]HLP37065.1 DUF4132 domain-containing protein [Lacibacter sp.]